MNLTIPPHSTEAEEAIVGCMLIDNDIINLIDLVKEDFYNQTLGKIYDLCKRIKKLNKPVDLVVLKEYLDNNNILDEVGGITYLVEIAESPSYTSNWEEYRNIVKDKSIRRQIIRKSHEMKTLAEDESIDASESLQAIDGISHVLFKDKKGSSIIELVDEWDDIREKYKIRGALGYPGPFRDIDKHTSGLIEGTVYMICAYSNVGKSSLAYAYVCDLLKKGKKVTFFSLEVPKGVLMTHLLRCYYGKTYEEIMHDDFYFEMGDFENLTIYDDQRKLDDIENITKSSSPDAVFIDFVQNLDVPGNGEYEKMTQAAIRIQKMAIENSCVVFNISQVNNDSRGKASSMQPKGSGALFASSDVILGMYIDAHELKGHLIKNKFGKNDLEFLISADFTKLQFSIVNNTFNDFQENDKEFKF